MHSPGADERESGTDDPDATGHPRAKGDAADSPATGDLSLGDLAAQLERDPGECQRALEGLASLEPETRLSIIRGLRDVPAGPGVVNLLRLLARSGEQETRETARLVLEEILESEPSDLREHGEEARPLPIRPGRTGELIRAGDHAGPLPIRCLITSVDGSGRGTIVLSSSLAGERRTAAFLCDLLHGIVDAYGVVEEESPAVGGLVDDVGERAGIDAIESPAELARGLLEGCLMLNESPVQDRVMEWLGATLGEIRPRPFPGLGDVPASDEGVDLHSRAGLVLDACPSWLDDSPLTFELAEEIFLREGRITACPERDAGAFRFLFEHRLIHRLELYRRMLLWMAWFWTCGGEQELVSSARLLGAQLADEQFAVPSQPFATLLTARSLEAAQRRLVTG
jgi:hypothetical protein